MHHDSKNSARTSGDVLKHYGVKGMKWGVKNADRPAASGDAVTFRGTKVKSKAGGVKSLSNKELQDYIQRANLERQFHQLNPTMKKQVGQFVASTLMSIGKQHATRLAGDFAAKQIAALLKK